MDYLDVDIIRENEILRKAVASRIHKNNISLYMLSRVSQVKMGKIEQWIEKLPVTINHQEIIAVCSKLGIEVSLSIEENELTKHQLEKVQISNIGKG